MSYIFKPQIPVFSCINNASDSFTRVHMNCNYPKPFMSNIQEDTILFWLEVFSHSA